MALEIDKRKAAALAMVLIVSFEGYSHKAYLDPVGIPTICRGHTENVHMGDNLSDDACDHITQEDLQKVVDKLDLPNLPDSIEGALADFCYNVGVKKCKASTLYAYIVSGQYLKACNEFPKWIYAHGKPYSGLIRRRQAERQLCMKGLKQ